MKCAQPTGASEEAARRLCATSFVQHLTAKTSQGLMHLFRVEADALHAKRRELDSITPPRRHHFWIQQVGRGLTDRQETLWKRG